MANPEDDSGEQITSQQRITKLLKDLKEQHTLLRVSIPEHDGTYTSTVLEVDPRKGIVVLDELNPKPGHVRLLASGTCWVNTQLNRVKLRFKGQLLSSKTDDGIASYLIKFPEWLHYAQNRRHFRINTPVAARPPITLTTAGGTSLEGNVTDLSFGGAGVLLSVDIPLERGSHFPDCQIQLPGGQEIHCSASVRYIQDTNKRSQQKIGLQLTNIDNTDARALQKCITQLQREQLKRQALS